MSNASPQPHTGIKPILSYNRAGETHTTLYNYARLLSVDRHGAVASCCFNIPIKGFTPCLGFVFEVIRKPMVTARMPDVGGYEAMPAFRALPQRALQMLFHFGFLIARSKDVECRAKSYNDRNK
jgi:hypothetical protein